MNVQNIQSSPIENTCSAEELSAAKKIFAGLMLACKKLSLYPHGHNICKESINHFHTQLTTFLQAYRTFKMQIERDQIISNGKAISSGLPDEGTLHFTLFRDGIRWLEFNEGIKQSEVDSILTIINRYSKLSTEPEGDIVTAFWEAQFPHMQYEVAEFFWGDGQEAGDGTSILAAGKSGDTQFREKNLVEKKSPENPAIDPGALNLTPHELNILKQMIHAEEEADLTSYLDALLDSLLQHQEKENFNIILEVLLEEFTGSLDRKEFLVSLKILKGLQYILEICKPELPWAVPLLDDFFQTVSGPETLTHLKDIWKSLDSKDAGILSEILKLLDPQAVHTLCLLFSQPQHVSLRQLLIDSIIFLASQNIHHLEKILFNSDEKLVEKLIPLIVEMEDGQSLKYLTKLSHHPSSRVRHEAIKNIFKRHAARSKDIFNLIDDKDESIRQLILKQLGQSRNDDVEDLLISYIQKIKFSNNDKNHLLQCYETLGKCGSLRSIPFLKETLLKGVWIPGHKRTVNRKGAAVALASLGLPEAEKTLNMAGRCLFPGVRNIVKTARQEVHS